MFGVFYAMFSIIVLGDFPGYAVAGVHEDDQILEFAYQVGCMVGHNMVCS